MISASASSASASSPRPASRNALADSWRRLRSRRSTATSSSPPSLAAFCNSERTMRSAPTRSFSPAFIAVTRSCLTVSAIAIRDPVYDDERAAHLHGPPFRMLRTSRGLGRGGGGGLADLVVGDVDVQRAPPDD